MNPGDEKGAEPALLPCPFCEGPAAFWASPRGGGNAVIECDWCDASTGDCATEENAIENWNRRVPPTSELDSAREALTRILAVMGPKVPSCCGCEYEWGEALRLARAALAGQKGKLNYQGRQTGTPGGEG